MKWQKAQFIRVVMCLGILFSALLINQNSWAKVKIALLGDSRENLDNACEDIADILLHQITDWDFNSIQEILPLAAEPCATPAGLY